MAFRLTGLLLCMSCAAHAAGLPDPTRPPAGFDAGSAAAAQPSGPVLQEVRTIGARRSAVISGQAVKVGSRVGDAMVTRIDEDRVQLHGPEGMQTLKLFPDVDKQPAAVAYTHKPRAKLRAHKLVKKAKRKEAE